jgi:membrane associated rhomboid family serine protease
MPRKPWMTAAIGIFCAFVFVFDLDHMEKRDVRVETRLAIQEYWKAHPYLVPDESLARRFDPADVTKALAERERRIADGTIPPQSVIDSEMKEWSEIPLRTAADPWHRRFGLVPANGWAQPGWITHMFMHAGWLHLIGNMIFLAAVGPVLEDLLTPFLFLGFYLLGGFVAALCQYAMAPDSTVPMVGASGAIAAAMGAFTVRFALDKMRVLIWLGWMFPVRIILVPGWLWGGSWIMTQLVALAVTGFRTSGVAFMAHIGGFFFGVGLMFLLHAVGLSDRIEDASSVRRTLLPEPKGELAEAERAYRRGNMEQAIVCCRLALRDDPENISARWYMTRLLFEAGEIDEASVVFEGLAAQWMENESTGVVEQALDAIGNQLDPRALHPEMAEALAPMLERVDIPRAMLAYEAAISTGSQEACIRLAELRWQNGNTEGARRSLEHLSAAVDPALTPRVEGLRRILGTA